MALAPEAAGCVQWVRWMRAHGWWVERMEPPPTGLPDYFVGRDGPNPQTWWVEAKAIGSGFKPGDLRESQRWFLDRVHRSGGNASLLLVGPESFLWLSWDGARQPLHRRVFDVAATSYE